MGRESGSVPQDALLDRRPPERVSRARARGRRRGGSSEPLLLVVRSTFAKHEDLQDMKGAQIYFCRNTLSFPTSRAPKTVEELDYEQNIEIRSKVLRM
jgi:hypothetical protein